MIDFADMDFLILPTVLYISVNSGIRLSCTCPGKFLIKKMLIVLFAAFASLIAAAGVRMGILTKLVFWPPR